MNVLVYSNQIAFGSQTESNFTGFSERTTCNVSRAGNRLRVIFGPAEADGAINCSHASIAVIGTATPPNAQFTPTELKFGGASGFVLGPSGGKVTSDWVDLTWLETDFLLVDIDFAAAGVGNSFVPTWNKGATWTGGPGTGKWGSFKSAGADYNNATVTGYTLSNFVVLVDSIEALGGGSICFDLNRASPQYSFSKGALALKGDGILAASGIYNVAFVTQSYASSGTAKVYWEFRIDTVANGPPQIGIGNASAGVWGTGAWLGVNTNSAAIFPTGACWSGGVNVSTGTSYAVGDIIMVAHDLGGGKLYFGKNGVWMNSANPAAGTGALITGLTTGPYFAGVASNTDTYTGTIALSSSLGGYTLPAGFTWYDPTILHMPVGDVNLQIGMALQKNRIGM